MKVCLVYASTSGNVEFTVEFVAKALKNSGFGAQLMRAEQVDIKSIAENKKFVFATSTWEHGRLNPFFQNIFDQMQVENFYGKSAAFIGLGDRRYEPVLFCKGIKDLRNLWLERGGGEVNTILKIQGEPYTQVDSVVAPWAYSLIKIWRNEND